MPATAEQLYSVANLHKQKNAEDFLRSHDSVKTWYTGRHDNRELYHNFLKGKQWTDDELTLLERKKKAPVVFNKLKPSERTWLGSILRAKYDMAPAPREPGDQDVSDILKARYLFHSYHSKIVFKDPQIFREAWVGGSAFQESYMDVRPGKKPRLVVHNQNPFAIYWDPDSLDLLDRSDAQFVDRASWLTEEQLVEAFPDMEGEIRAALDARRSEEGSTFTDDDASRRLHESQDVKNGKYKVVERFYKAKKKNYHGFNPMTEDRKDIGVDPDFDTRTKFKTENPEHVMAYDEEDFLYIAIACGPVSTSEFLFNGEYHCQPRDPDGLVLWPIIELVYEELDGEASGNVEHQMGMNRVINSMFTNKLHNAKNAVNTSKILNGNAFDETEQDHFAESHTDGDQVFVTKDGFDPARAAAALPHDVRDPHTDGAMEIANKFQEELSSTPPALRGQSEGSASGVLNGQRIEQAEVQKVPVVLNIRNFLRKRAELWAAYDRIYATEEETFRVIEKKNPEDSDFVTMNQTVVDQYGNVSKVNDISTAAYDIVFEDSFQSPTNRQKLLEQITQFNSLPGVQMDPALTWILAKWFFRISDAPSDLKAEINEASTTQSQLDMKEKQLAQQGQEIQQQGQLQDVAQKEAEQTFIPPEVQAPGGAPNANLFQAAAVPGGA